MLTIVIVLGAIAILWAKYHYYWKGRLDGWSACEKMVTDRAREIGYSEAVWEDLLQ